MLAAAHCHCDAAALGGMAKLVTMLQLTRDGTSDVIGNSFLRFALVGFVNTSVGYGVILLLHYVVGFSPVFANFGGYAIGTILSYALNRRFTFASGRPHKVALPQFAIAAAGCFLLNLLVLNIGLNALSLPVALAQAMAVTTYTVFFYLASRFLIFREQGA
jgi:putative flippase GtrA